MTIDRKRLVFGAGQLHRLLSSRRRQDILAQAREVGFAAFDVAPSYGNGLCEAELGLALRSCRDRVQIATKFGIPVPYYGSRFRNAFTAIRVLDKAFNPRYASTFSRRDFSRTELLKSVQGSLRRLRTDYIDTLFLHEPIERIDLRQWDEILGEIRVLRERGVIRHFGIAGHIAPVLDLLGSPEVEYIQAPLGDIRTIHDQITASMIAFGMYRTHASEAQPGQTFGNFLDNACELLPRCRFVLSTGQPATLQGMGELLQ